MLLLLPFLIFKSLPLTPHFLSLPSSLSLIPQNNAKATNLENWCKRNSHTFVCADYYGVARSSGDFAAGTDWGREGGREGGHEKDGKVEDNVVVEQCC